MGRMMKWFAELFLVGGEITEAQCIDMLIYC